MAGVDTRLPSPEPSGIILAGGQSRRFGADKALLPLGGRPLIAHTVEKLVALSDDVVVVTNSDAYARLSLPVRLIPDERPGEGSLMGIYSGLRAARHAVSLVVACDMPFLDLSLLRYMLRLAADYDVVMPTLEGMCEPLHAVYTRACVGPIARLLARGERQIIAFLPDVRVRYVTVREVDLFDPQRLSFVNVNTPEDWERVQRLVVPGAD
jgi:molybdopterin-guanine dinucleotide biosynthesis protein A